ncbi:hypothetical protein HQ325_16710 [Rhodococcus sp. BP-349]|uniref:hypothetical protein n=1 Tax=unclassified Rhodococcus (in: high G+C Gram-positive bacteria) TaxID=192944 RepID=UPI001C9AF1D7|nr:MULTISPECIES: hypothetical protein [unclassified Rhodococcus (in: high G+C Gram-positive bacteria)]MBY6540317.1 hypothetical protein [Rhodococcus sp. BP-363]MBY6545658.1 hypothetical protein [Rhodococcus sp. BP-369]MBY6564888.1 hypothetical protein [Rhodococcus sp. BP-370]MBY6578176.1 hypothetical protein [Rhodococcus sp. BP-364]MBY6587477.1 hypothetical protein [Rhodococcus sp. BP-358]
MSRTRSSDGDAQSKKVPELGTDAAPNKLSHRDLTGLAGAGVSLLGGGNPEEAVGKGIAARGYAGATNASLDYHMAWTDKLSKTKGFWRRLKIIIIG